MSSTSAARSLAVAPLAIHALQTAVATRPNLKPKTTALVFGNLFSLPSVTEYLSLSVGQASVDGFIVSASELNRMSSRGISSIEQEDDDETLEANLKVAQHLKLNFSDTEQGQKIIRRAVLGDGSPGGPSPCVDLVVTDFFSGVFEQQRQLWRRELERNEGKLSKGTLVTQAETRLVGRCLASTQNALQIAAPFLTRNSQIMCRLPAHLPSEQMSAFVRGLRGVYTSVDCLLDDRAVEIVTEQGIKAQQQQQKNRLLLQGTNNKKATQQRRGALNNTKDKESNSNTWALTTSSSLASAFSSSASSSNGGEGDELPIQGVTVYASHAFGTLRHSTPEKMSFEIKTGWENHHYGALEGKRSREIKIKQDEARGEFGKGSNLAALQSHRRRQQREWREAERRVKPKRRDRADASYFKDFAQTSRIGGLALSPDRREGDVLRRENQSLTNSGQKPPMQGGKPETELPPNVLFQSIKPQSLFKSKTPLKDPLVLKKQSDEKKEKEKAREAFVEWEDNYHAKAAKYFSGLPDD